MVDTADTALRRPPGIVAAEWLRPLPPAARFAFYGDAAAQAVAAAAWGPEFSVEPCRAKVRGTRAALWLGPGEYLLLDMAAGPADGSDPPPDRNAATFSEFESALAQVPHALVDVSHRQFALEVSGPRAAAILNGACPLDLDLHEFPVGMCTRTVFAKADIVLWRTHGNSFHVEIWRSFAGYVTGVLNEIAREFYPER
jgi:sarcosine oxidase subunit gamma